MVIDVRRPQAGRIETLQLIFLRAMGMFFVIFAIQYWARLTGVFDGSQYRFDTMSQQWKVASALLAVLMPATALGLWGGYRWGVLLWLIAASAEITMHVAMMSQFGRSDLRVIFHVLGLATLAGFWLSKFVLANKR